MAGVRFVSLVLVVAAFNLTACSNADRAGMSSGDRRLCAPFPAVAQTSNQPQAPINALPVNPLPITADPAAALEDCLHRWGYALAISPDEASQVATASVAACGSTLARWNQQTIAIGGRRRAIEAPSLLSGQPTTPIAEHFIFAQSRALFYVVQARAGKCAPPPISNGVPTGLTS
jgi:hypothetical protein